MRASLPEKMAAVMVRESDLMSRYEELKEEIKEMRKRFNEKFDIGADSDEIYRMSVELDEKLTEFMLLEKERCEKNGQGA